MWTNRCQISMHFFADTMSFDAESSYPKFSSFSQSRPGGGGGMIICSNTSVGESVGASVGLLVGKSVGLRVGLPVG